MTTGQNKSLPKPSPGKSLVLPQVRYHPSIQNSVNSGRNSRAQKMEKTQNQKKECPKGTRAVYGDGLRSGQDFGTTEKKPLKTTNAISTVSEGPKSSPFSQDPNSGAPPQGTSIKGAGLGAKGPAKLHSVKMPQARYHPSIQNPPDCARNGTSQKSVGTKDCEHCAVNKNQTGTDLESSNPQATSSRAGDGLYSGLSSGGRDPGTTLKATPPKGKTQNGSSRAGESQESDGTGIKDLNPNRTKLETNSRCAAFVGPDSDGPKCGTTPKRTRPRQNNARSVGDGQESNGTVCEEAPRLETPNSRSAAEGLPQTGTKQEERNARLTGGDAPEPDDTNSVTLEEAAVPRGPDGLSLDPLVLDVGSTLDQSLVEKVEVLTRGQSTNPQWFRARKNRITASVAHDIAHCRFVQDKSTAPPGSCLKAITGEGPRVQTRAMTWGIENEKKAVQKYKALKSAALGRPVSVLDCGLFIDCSKPWLAASPDGIVTDGSTGQWLRSLEVKCPFKHRNQRIEEACNQDPRFCLEILEPQGTDQIPVFGLKRSHPYFTQVQFQMAVTGLQKADFVVFTLRDLAVVQVDFDPGFWEETVSRLEKFYFRALVPFLREQSPQWNHEV